MVGWSQPENLVNGSVSRGLPVMSGVPQGCILGPVLFHIFLNEEDNQIGCTLIKFADDSKLSSAVDIAEKRDAIQKAWIGLRSRSMLPQWSSTKPSAKFCTCVGVIQNMYRLGELVEQSCGKALGGPRGWKASTASCSSEGQLYQGCNKRGVARKAKEVIVPLFSSTSSSCCI